MPATNDTRLIEFGGWTLRVQPSKGPARRLLLMIHGWTGDENSMWVFAGNAPADRYVLAPRAPYRTEPAGYSWRVLHPDRGESPTLDELRHGAVSLMALIDNYCRTEAIPCDTFDTVGFSQGAAVASTLALLYPARLARVGMLSGFVPAGADELVLGRPLQSLRFFVAHGSLDETVSIEDARRSVGLLRRAGADVTVCEDEVGHKVSAACARALQAFLLG